MDSKAETLTFIVNLPGYKGLAQLRLEKKGGRVEISFPTTQPLVTKMPYVDTLAEGFEIRHGHADKTTLRFSSPFASGTLSTLDEPTLFSDEVNKYNNVFAFEEALPARYRPGKLAVARPVTISDGKGAVGVGACFISPSGKIRIAFDGPSSFRVGFLSFMIVFDEQAAGGVPLPAVGGAPRDPSAAIPGWVGKINAAITSLKSDNAALRDSLAVTNDRYNTVTNVNNVLSAELAKLKAESAALAAELAKVKSEVRGDGKHAGGFDYATVLATHASEISAANAGNKSLHAVLEVVSKDQKAQNEKLEGVCAALLAHVDKLAARVTAIETDVAGVKTMQSHLSKWSAQMQSELEAANTLLSQ